jgi:hypothetical protein
VVVAEVELDHIASPWPAVAPKLADRSGPNDRSGGAARRLRKDACPAAGAVATVVVMTAQLELRPDHLGITFPGALPLITLKRSLTLPWRDVVSAHVERQAEAKRSLGVRVGGGYWPGWFATGHFTYKGRKGERQLWCCYRAVDVLVIETRRAKPRRVVLQLDDPADAARRISDVLGVQSPR